MTTIVLYKPYGVLSKFTDPDGRPTLADFIHVPGVYPAGRLDKDSEGLMILTDEASLQKQITDPIHHLGKVYLVQVERIPEQAALEALRAGIVIRKRKTRPAQVELLDSPPAILARPVPIRYRKNVPTVWLRLTLREGRNRQIRHMTAAIGHPTLRLVRVAIGPITLDGLEAGRWRYLDSGEVDDLRQAASDPGRSG